jgi:hypothetical protein
MDDTKSVDDVKELEVVEDVVGEEKVIDKPDKEEFDAFTKSIMEGEEFGKVLDQYRKGHQGINRKTRQTKIPKDKATLIRRQKNKLARKARRANRK